MKKIKLRAWVLGMDGEMQMAKDLQEEDACALYIREHNRQKESCRVMLFSGGNFHAVNLRRNASILLSFVHAQNANRVIGNIYENPELLH